MKEAERILLKAQERFDKEKKKANKARRIKTVTTSGIFEDEDLERQLANFERESVRKGNSGRTKLRRVRKGNLVNMSSSSSQRAVSEKYEQPSGMGVAIIILQRKPEKNMKKWTWGQKRWKVKGIFKEYSPGILIASSGK